MVIRPPAVKDTGFEIVRTDEGAYLIRGERPSRWVNQTDFTNDEAVGYLADRLARLGVEEALAKAGAEAGDTVLIGDFDDAVVFDWAPELSAGGGHAAARAARTGVWKDEAVHDPAGHRAARPDIAGSPRTVVKIGSSSLTTKNGAIDDARIAALTGAIAARAHAGHQVLLVSSGAIATGLAPLGCRSARATWPPSRRRRASARACSSPATRRRSGARPRRRPGAADRGRPDAPRPLPQRPADPRPPARTRRRPDHQRERHGGHRRDPLRRQRPAGRPGRPRQPGQRPHPALRRGRPVRRRPEKGQREEARRGRRPRDLESVKAGEAARAASAGAACPRRSTRR